MTANLRTLTKEKRESPMKRLPMPAKALAAMKKIAFAILSVTLLMLFAAPAEAQCPAVGAATGCGVTITITGSSGNFVATFAGGGTANGNPFDGAGGEDVLVGIQNNSSVAVGAIILSAPSVGGFDNLFQFETPAPGDGPCFFNNDDCFLTP